MSEDPFEDAYMWLLAEWWCRPLNWAMGKLTDWLWNLPWPRDPS